MSLGCGEYEAFILTRGGGSIVARPEWSALSWGRVLNDTSDASLRVDAECIGALSSTRPWQHELSIHRDGAQVWVGPVVKLSSPVEQDRLSYVVEARGITAWWDHRLISLEHDYSTTPTDVSTIFKAFSDDAMDNDNTPGLICSPSPSGIFGTTTVTPGRFTIAGPQLRDLSRQAVDWTEINRTVLAGGITVPAATLNILRDEHFAMPPAPTLDGLKQGNFWVVIGAGTGESGAQIYAEAANIPAQVRDGLLESIDTISTITNFDAAVAASESRIDLTSEDVVTIDRAQLAPSAPVSIDELIPGAIAPLNLVDTLLRIPVKGDFRISAVDVEVNADEEKIMLTFQPPGTTA